MFDFPYARDLMVERQLAARGIKDARLLEAMRQVPREAFVPAGMDEFAYEDAPLSIGEGQTISQPYIVARMTEEARIDPGDRVLEVGTGSGYGAAVAASLAEEVVTIERNQSLGQQAKHRLTALGYDNAHVHIGDGSKGWPAKSPYHAIIVTAGGPAVPEALKEQLEIGGILVIPVGEGGEHQRLLRIRRISADQFEEEDLGGVLFVPLIGEQGWPDRTDPVAKPAAHETLSARIEAALEDLPSPEADDFGAAFDRFADRRVVLLGEASHGTSEFYRARAAITKRLVDEHGFSVIAIEADWPDAASLNRYVRGEPQPEGEAAPFQRFPTWMWRNREVDAFLGWLRSYNAAVPAERQVGLYGLDLYNMSGSIAAVLAYLDAVDPEAARVARERYGCLTPWQNEPAIYGRAALTSGYSACEEAVVKQCKELLERQLARSDSGDETVLDAAQNARLVAAAEKYYRVMYYGGAAAWNLRDQHMFDTLEQVLEAKGPEARAVVWAHNSHIGDARETDMGTLRGELNVGQLCRQRFGDEAALIGFGTHTGTVAAASDWDGEMEIKSVRPSLEESVERCFHASEKARAWLDFSRHGTALDDLSQERLERFIGVIYRPETERQSHYAHVALTRQFDAYVWFDETRAVTPLEAEPAHENTPETFPFGV